MNQVHKIKQSIQTTLCALPLRPYQPLFQDIHFLLNLNPYVLDNEQPFFQSINADLIRSSQYFDSKADVSAFLDMSSTL